MTEAQILDLARSALLAALVTLGPIAAVALVVGLAVAVFQAVTQLNEPTMTFVPKIIGVMVVLILMGPLMMDRMLQLTRESFEHIALILR